MLIGHCLLTEKGLLLIDCDGGHRVEITAEDALLLAEVIEQHRKALQEIVERKFEKVEARYDQIR